MPLRILDVGQCGFDHDGIADWLTGLVGAEVDFAATAADVESALDRQNYQLCLINRILDADGSSGVELIRRLRQRPQCPPLMLVSNRHEAQQQAVAAGAVEGFGKAQIHLPQVAEHVKEVLRMNDADMRGASRTGGLDRSKG